MRVAKEHETQHRMIVWILRENRPPDTCQCGCVFATWNYTRDLVRDYIRNLRENQ